MVYNINNIKEFLKSPSNFLSFLIALIPGILLYMFSPAEPVRYVYFAISVLFCLALIWISIMLFIKDIENIKLINELKNDLTKLQSTSNHNCKIINCFPKNNICLCSSPFRLNGNTLVSFYLKESEIEHLIAYGTVSNIQDDGYIQIKPYCLNSKILEENNLSLLEFLKIERHNIIVKSTIPLEVIKTINEGVI